MSMNFHRKLPIPKEVKEEFPLTSQMASVKARRDNQIRAVFEGKSDKFLLIIGPCSADTRNRFWNISPGSAGSMNRSPTRSS